MRSVFVDVRDRAHTVFVLRRVIHILGASKASGRGTASAALPQKARAVLVSSGGHVSWLFSESTGRSRDGGARSMRTSRYNG